MYYDKVDEILHKYSDMVYRIAFSRTKNTADAEDILQDVFMRYITCEMEFADEVHIKVWLIRATCNCSKNVLSSAWFRRTTELNDDILTQFNEPDSVYPMC